MLWLALGSRKSGPFKAPSTDTLMEALSAVTSRQGAGSQNCDWQGHQGPGFLDALAGGWMEVSQSGSDKGLINHSQRVPGSAGR